MMDVVSVEKTEISVLKSVLDELKKSLERLEERDSASRKECLLLTNNNQTLHELFHKNRQNKNDLQNRIDTIFSDLNGETVGFERCTHEIGVLRSQASLVTESHSSLVRMRRVLNSGTRRLDECQQVLKTVLETEALLEKELHQAKSLHQTRLSQHEENLKRNTENLTKNWGETCRLVKELEHASQQLCQVTHYNNSNNQQQQQQQDNH